MTGTVMDSIVVKFGDCLKKMCPMQVEVVVFRRYSLADALISFLGNLFS